MREEIDKIFKAYEKHCISKSEMKEQLLNLHNVSQREFKVGDFVWFNGEIWQINELYKEEKGAEVKKVNSTETRYPNLDDISHFG